MLPAIVAAHGPELDLGRVVFVIMALVGVFLQWLSNWWKQKRAEAERLRQMPPTPEELEARKKVWQHETGIEERKPPPLVARNPLEDLLKTFREIAAPEIVAPPVVIAPSPQPRSFPVTGLPKLVPTPAKVPSAPAAFVQQRPRHPLAVKLAAIGGLRQAVVLREILSPPKALQSVDDHLI